MLRAAMTGLVALALVVLANDDARAGAVHSPFTKAQAKEARIVLYEHELALRNANPTAFDATHPLLGSVLSGEAGYDQFLAKNHFFSANRPGNHGLLCEHDPFIWRVVEGDILYHKLHPFSNPTPLPHTGPNLVIDPPPGGGPPGGGPPDPPPGGNFHTASVPEPSSWVLMVSGVTLAIYAAARRRNLVVIDSLA